jgi:HEPN domain-containing protein
MRRTRHGKDSRKYFDWLEISARDLLAARLLIELEQCYDIAAFHCQQCIEKSLKAYIIDRTGILVDGHNLTWLCRQAMKHNSAFKRWMDKTAQMNRLYIETRYPSDIDLMFNDEKINQVYETAKDIYDFICTEVYGGDGSLDDD